jgi:uncharacterized protein with gpF-like domain
MPDQEDAELTSISEWADFPLFFFPNQNWTYSHYVKANQGFDRFARSREPVYRTNARQQLRRDFERMERTIRVILNPDISSYDPPTETKQDEEEMEEVEERMRVLQGVFAAEWLRRFRRLNMQTARPIIATINDELGADVDIFNPTVLDEIETRAQFLADKTTIANMDAVLDQVAEGIRANETNREIADRVRRIHNEGLFRTTADGRRIQILDAQQRSTLIARTETTALSNGTSLRAVQVSGLDKWKRWVTVGDDRVRDAHVAEEFNTVPLDAVFPVTGLEYPQEPNCRCSLVYVDPPDDADASNF